MPLLGKNSKLQPQKRPKKYYQIAGYARRTIDSDTLEAVGEASFDNGGKGTTAGVGFLPGPQEPLYLVTELNDELITEDNNNIIQE